MKEITDALNAMPINQEYVNPTPSIAGAPTLDSGTHVPSGAPQPQAVQQPQEYREPLPRSSAPGMILGPKYLSALDKVNSMADIRSFSTQLPIIGGTATVSPLTGAEEQVLRTSSTDPEGFLTSINKIIYDHTTFSNATFDSFEDFLAKFYPQDKSLLIWALLAASYSNLPAMQKRCGKCQEVYEVNLKPEDIMKADGLPSMWEEDKAPEDFRVIKTILDGSIIFEIGLPSEKDRVLLSSLYNAEQVKKNIEQTGTVLSYVDNLTFFIKRVIIKDPDGDIILSNILQDIYPFMKNLSPKVKDLVQNAIDLKEFDKYVTDFYEILTCDHCGARERIEMVPEVEFFRKALSTY